MGAVFKKEFRSNLTNIIGIIFVAVMLVAFGWNFVLLSFKASFAKTEFAFVHLLGMSGQGVYVWLSNGFPFITLILASLLTMKTGPEERHQKTDILLYSLPISATKVIMGKYLALVATFALPFAVFAVSPIIAGLYGDVNYIMAYGAILAYFLLGCAVIAVCMFLSSLTENQVVCAVMGIAAVLVIYFLPQLADSLSDSSSATLLILIVIAILVAVILYLATKNTMVATATLAVLVIASVAIYIIKPELYVGLAGKIVSSVGLFEKMTDFANGIVDVGTYIYYISFAALFCYFTVQSFEKRRWN